MIINNYCLTNRNSTDFGWLSLVKLIVWKRSEKIEKLTVHVRLFFSLIRKIRWIDIFFRTAAESAKWKSWLLTLSKRMTNDILVRRSRCVFSTIFVHWIERDWTTGIRCVWIPSIRHDSEVMKIYSARLLVTQTMEIIIASQTRALPLPYQASTQYLRHKISLLCTHTHVNISIAIRLIYDWNPA